nr:MAG TPA: hypothetical protein [Caudoviricetes sp.]
MPPVMENVKTASHEVRLADGIKMNLLQTEAG